MKLTRRGFIGILGTAAVAAGVDFALDPERLLWVPGQKTFFLPPEKTLVSGDEAVAELAQLSGRSGRRVSTAAGLAFFDHADCLIEINGVRVDAFQAAALRNQNYQRSGRPMQPNGDAVLAMVIAQRTAAGWKDPFGKWKGPLPNNPMGNGYTLPKPAPVACAAGAGWPKIVLEG